MLSVFKLIKTEFSYSFEWLVETGRIELPKGPIWDPRAWRTAQRGRMGDTEWNNQRYEKGFFSPLKWMGDTQTGKKANDNNYFDVTGTDTPYNPHKMYRYRNEETNYVSRYPDAYPQRMGIPAPPGGP